MERKYTAFISYRHDLTDSAVAKKLHSLIEQYRIPKELRRSDSATPGLVFRDQEELRASSSLSGEIRRALDNAEFLIVICSENTRHSRWVPQEIAYFLKHHPRDNVLTVLISGDPEEVFPHQLTHERDPETGQESRIEPLAVDVRSGTIFGIKRKLRRELPRLLAPILACDYDALVLREQRRKLLRFTSFIAAGLAVTLGFSSMLLAKNNEIEEKNTELAQQKEELAQQKAAVQLRESELLTLDARDALASGDLSTAIQKAYSALPKPGEENRPYYAPAEAALMEAMNIFGDGNTSGILRNTILEQRTSIADFCISRDGTRVATIDAYGETHCFDAENGDLLWKASAVLPNQTGTNNGRHIRLCSDQNVVLSSHGSILEAYSLHSGQHLWRREIPYAQDNCLFYHEKTDALGYIEVVPGEDGGYDYRLQLLSAENGIILQTIPIASRSRPDYSFTPIFSDSCPESAVFSEDGTLFAGVFLDETNKICCFTADLIQGTSEITYRHPQASTYDTVTVGICFRDNDRTLLIAVQDLKTFSALSVLKVQRHTGQLLWQADTPLDSNSYLYWGVNSFACFRPESILVGTFDHLFSLDPDTGAILHSLALPGVLTYLETVSDTTFAFSLNTGTHAIGWQLDSGEIILSTDSNFQISASLGASQKLLAWGGGIVQRYEKDGLITLSISNAAGPGYVAFIPESQENTIRIVHPTQLQSAIERSVYDTPGKSLSPFYHFNAVQPDGRLIMGPLTVMDVNSYASQRCYASIDPDDGKLQYQALPADYASDSRLYWLPDGRGYIIHDAKGTITLTRGDKTESLFSSDSSAALFAYNFCFSASGYINGETELLTVGCGTDTLTLWRNGKQKRSISLPKDLVPTRDREYDCTRFLEVGRNGYILVSLHHQSDNIAMRDMSVYDTRTGQWTEFIDQTQLSRTDSIALAQENSLMAAVDTAAMIRIYDLSTGEQIQQFSAQLPPQAITNLGFLLDDTCLMVRTDDCQILIYEIATGAILYQDRLGVSRDNEELRAYEDEVNHRLYLTVGDSASGINGICLDLRSWTCLAYITDMLYFDSQAGTLYQCTQSLYRNIFSSVRVPGTAELVALAAEYLG